MKAKHTGFKSLSFKPQRLSPEPTGFYHRLKTYRNEMGCAYPKEPVTSPLRNHFSKR